MGMYCISFRNSVHSVIWTSRRLFPPRRVNSVEDEDGDEVANETAAANRIAIDDSNSIFFL